MLDITDVRVFPVDEAKLKAIATITLGDCFVVRDVKIIDGAGGLFVSMPAKKRRDGTYKDIAHPLDGETRAQIENAVISAYQRQTAAPK